MIRRLALAVFLGIFTIALFIPSEIDAAPEKGFVYVRTTFSNGVPAPFIPITIVQLEGSYPIPPGDYMTDSIGRIWIALYPGVYRFAIPRQGVQPWYWEVPLSSRQEIPIQFIIPGPVNWSYILGFLW